MAEPTDAPCIPITVHTFGLDDKAWNALFDRVGNAAHALDEQLFTASTGSCPHCVDEPDWADVREAARKLGWSGRRDPDEPRARIWGRYGKGRMFIDWEHGWVRVWQTRDARVVNLAGPSRDYANETVHLINPTPARVLDAARLVGIGGDRG